MTFNNMSGLLVSKKSLILIVLYLFTRASNQVLLKMVAVSSSNYKEIFYSPLFYISCLLFFLQAIIWIKVLKEVALSVAYPFTALIFIFILVSGYAFFNEPINVTHIIGVFIIIYGVVVVSTEKTTSSSS